MYSSCRDSLCPFIPEDFKVGKEYVDRSTLARELADFKVHVTSELGRLRAVKAEIGS